MDASGNGVAPFAIDQGIVKILNARIQGALIDDLVVKTSNIEPGAVSRWFTASGETSFNLVVNHGLGSPIVKVEWKVFLSSVSEFGAFGAELRSVTDSTLLESITVHSPQILFSSVLFTPPADRESTTFSLVSNGAGVSVLSRNLFALVFKR